MITSSRWRAAAFAAASTAIAVVALIAFRSAAYARQPDMIAWGVTFDLTLTIPLPVDAEPATA